MTNTIYTYGYGGKHPEELEKLVAQEAQYFQEVQA